MDVVKTRRTRSRAARLLAAGILPVLLVSAWFGVDRIRRAAPTIERETLWIGEVERGPMTLSVRGPGAGFPHAFHVAVAEERIDLAVSGRWTARWLPRACSRAYLKAVVRAHVRLIRGALEAEGVPACTA